MVISVPRFSICAYALSLVYDRHTKSTNALLYGFTDADYHGLTDILTSTACSSSQHPVMLASYMFRCYRERAETYRTTLDKHIYMTEMSLGYAVPGTLMTEIASTGAGKPDFGRVIKKLQNAHEDYMRKLHMCQIELVSLNHACDFGKHFGEFLRKVVDDFNKMQPVQDRPPSLATADERMLHEIEFQTNLWSTLSSQQSALKERTQIHINLVGVSSRSLRSHG